MQRPPRSITGRIGLHPRGFGFVEFDGGESAFVVTRRDLRAIPTVTIDALVTKDLDDALAVLPAAPDGALRLLVPISDVDALVPEGSALDLESLRCI
ncbi:MAG: RNB domain-containing ribonuclease [Myxococcales bacterium]